MPKYVTKPVVKEAERFFKDTKPWPTGVSHDGYDYVVKSAGGIAIVFDGDYIVTEPDGRGLYPCRPDIFEARHDPLPE